MKDELESIAVEEMKHAEMLAERLFYLGEKLTTKPTPILVGDILKEILERDKKDEEGAIEHRRKLTKMAWDECDHTTHRLVRQILADEEAHHDTFISLLEEICNRKNPPFLQLNKIKK